MIGMMQKKWQNVRCLLLRYLYSFHVLLTIRRWKFESSKYFRSFLVLQAHDGEKLTVGQWIAVAYNENFYVGQVTNINNDRIKIKFLTKKEDGFYK